MKKQVLILILAFCAIDSTAQTLSTADMIIKRSLTLAGKKVTGISTDSTGASKSNEKLITEKAAKNYADSLALSGGGGGSITLAPIASTPNANGATITGSTLNFEPANNIHGGVLSNTTQSWLGNKTNLDNFTINKSLYLPNSSGTDGIIYRNGTRWAHNLGASTYNVFLGQIAGSSSAGVGSVGIGGAAMIASTANFSIGIGWESLQNMTTSGDGSVSIGKSAMQNATGGTNAIAIGTQALQSVTAGFSNIAIGKLCLPSFISGTGNVAVAASTNLQYGDFNTFIGSDGPLSMISGGYNTQVGGFSQQGRKTGDYNTTLGFASLQSDTTGINNTVLGSFAGQNFQGNSNVLIGYGAGSAETILNGKLIVSNTTSTTHLINGDFGQGKIGINKTLASTLANSANFQVNGSVDANGKITVPGTTSNTFNWAAASGTPSNTTTAVGWVRISINGADAWLPYYQ